MPRNRLPAPFLTAGPAAEGLADADLVARFLADRDAAAFEALVWRHGPMVRAVCRSVLRNAADADDAFQATFLVLSRKAAAVRRPGAVGGWLYGVAVRVARKLKKSAGRRPVPQDLNELAGRVTPAADSDLWPVLDEEIQRLPERYRAAVHLCYVAGLTTAEAAAQLGIPKGTVLSRLAWARGRLQARLTRRGITAGVVVLTSAATTATARLLDPQLVRDTVHAALAGVGAAVPATIPVASLTATSLSQGVITEMALNKVRAAALALVAGLAAAGVGVGGWAMAGRGEGGTTTADKATAPPPRETPAVSPPPAATPNAANGPKSEPPKIDAPKAVTLQDVLDRLEKQEKVNRELRKELDRLNAAPAIPSEVVPPSVPITVPPISPAPPSLPLVEVPPAESLPKLDALPVPAGTTPPAVVPAAPAPAVEAVPGGNAKHGTMTIAKPGGTWYRVAGDTVYSLTFTEDRLTITTDGFAPRAGTGAEARPATVTIEADYAVSKDGVVFGYVTGVDAPEGAGGNWQALEEQPFAFRFRADEKALTVKDVKVRRAAGAPPAATADGAAGEIEKLLIAGRYTDKKPAYTAPAIPRLDPPGGSVVPRAMPSAKGKKD